MGDGDNTSAFVAPADGKEELPYRIELWAASAVERIIARAQSPEIARVIFKAAVQEYPGRRITMAQSGSILADSAS